MPPVYKEQIIVPRAAIKLSPPNRCSLDFGGSLIKIAHCIVKEDEETTVTLYLAGFLNSQLEEALAFVNEFIDPLENASKEFEIYFSGVGIYREREKIDKALGSRKWKFEMEYAQQKKSFELFTQRICIGDGFHHFEEKTLEDCNDIVNEFMCAWGKMNAIGEEGLFYHTTAPWIETINKFNSLLHRQKQDCHDKEGLSFKHHFPDMFPSLIAILGSACVWQLVKADCSTQAYDFNSRSGPTLMGLGSLLTGATTYEELLKLAEKGNTRKINLFAGSCTSNDPDDPYSHYPRGYTLHSFAQAQMKGIDDCSKEDLARAVLETVVNDIVQSTVYIATLKKTKTIFFCGNMTNHWLVRHEIMKAYCVRRCMTNEIDAHCYFPRYGGYMAAIGGIL